MLKKTHDYSLDLSTSRHFDTNKILEIKKTPYREQIQILFSCSFFNVILNNILFNLIILSNINVSRYKLVSYF